MSHRHRFESHSTPLQAKSPLKTVTLVTAGVVIGIALMLIVQYTLKASDKPVQVAERTTDSDQASTAPPAPAAPAPTSYSAGFGTPSQQAPMPTAPGNGWVQNNDIPQGRDIEYAQTGSGYTIYTGRKAVDSDQSVNLGNGTPFVTDQYGNQTDMNAQPIGRNGLKGNPCVDPPSTFGASYGRNGR